MLAIGREEVGRSPVIVTGPSERQKVNEEERE